MKAKKILLVILFALILLVAAQQSAGAARGFDKGVRHIPATPAEVYPARGPQGLPVFRAPNVHSPIIKYLQNFDLVTVTACKGFQGAYAKTEYGWVWAWNLRPNPCGGWR